VAYGRAVLRWTVWVIAGVALVVGVTVASLPWLVRTGAGHRKVEQWLTRLLNERVPGTVSVGRLRGSVIGGLTAENVVVRNPRGELVGRADVMSACWRPLALIRRREIDELTVRNPRVALDRGSWRIRPGPPAPSTTVARISARDGTVTTRGQTVEQVTGSATLHTSSSLDVHALSARAGPVRLTAYGVVGWGGQQRGWVATRVAVRAPGRGFAGGDIFYTPERIEVALAELTVAAPLATRLVGGRGPVRVRGDMQGAPHRMTASIQARQDARSLWLRAVVDGPRRAVDFDATLTSAPQPIRLHASARYVGGTLVVPAASATVGRSRVAGSGRLSRRALHGSLAVRLAPPEARRLALRTHSTLTAQVAMDGLLTDLAVSAQARLQAARLALRARADLPARRGRAEIAVDQLELAQLSPGAPAMLVSASLAVDGRWIQRALVADLRLAHGRLRVRGRDLDQLSGAGTVRLAGTGEARIRRLAGRLVGWRGKPNIAARGRVRWSASRVAISSATVWLAESRWTGDAGWLRGRAVPRISARAAMTLAPGLVAHLLGRRPPRAWVGRANLDGTPNDFALRLDAATKLGPLRVLAHVRRGNRELELRGVDARLGESHASGAAHLRRGRLTASLDELVLSPALIHELRPALDPGWPVILKGTLDGPLDALDLQLALDAGPTTADLRGRVAARARRFRLTGRVDTFDLATLKGTKTRVRGTLALAAEGRLAEGGVVGTLTVRKARGFMMTSPFYRGSADARLQGRSFVLTRARVELPGAKIAGNGHGVLSDNWRIGYGVVITDALQLRRVPTAVKVLIGINGILPGSTIVGALEKRPGEKVHLTHRVLPIGVSQLRFLFQVLTGRVPLW
jgi:hypothetical protein